MRVKPTGPVPRNLAQNSSERSARRPGRGEAAPFVPHAHQDLVRGNACDSAPAARRVLASLAPSGGEGAACPGSDVAVLPCMEISSYGAVAQPRARLVLPVDTRGVLPPGRTRAQAGQAGVPRDQLAGAGARASRPGRVRGAACAAGDRQPLAEQVRGSPAGGLGPRPVLSRKTRGRGLRALVTDSPEVAGRQAREGVAVLVVDEVPSPGRNSRYPSIAISRSARARRDRRG